MKKIILVPALLLFGLIAKHVFHLLDTYPEQDACSFPGIANAQYRVFLKEAAVDLSKFCSGRRDCDALDFHDVVSFAKRSAAGQTSMASAVAHIHAAMRAMGGVLVTFGGSGTSRRLGYEFDVGRLMPFSGPFAVVRWSEVHLGVEMDPLDGPIVTLLGGITTGDQMMSLRGGLKFFYRPRSAGCPA